MCLQTLKLTTTYQQCLVLHVIYDFQSWKQIDASELQDGSDYRDNLVSDHVNIGLRTNFKGHSIH